MNCIKCPILEECETSKMNITTEYPSGIMVVSKAAPLDIEECPLLIAVAAAKVRALEET